MFDANTDKALVEAQALEDENVAKFTDGKTIVKVIVVPNKLVNIVAK
jgi:leucyl-tRNA synthetase